MQASVYCNSQLIGMVDLGIGDESMGCIFGDLKPTDLYYKNVQKHVWEFWSSCKPDYQRWQSLRLNVQLENGYFLHPVGGYTIDDVPELPSELKRIDIVGVNRQLIENFFLQETPRPFVEDPWERIAIEQKIAFEDELKKEIGLASEALFVVKKNESISHRLANFDFSALCKYGGSDDVLFAVRRVGFDEQFAVIHLTWSGKREADNFPVLKFYNDFDEFKYFRMYPDKAGWED